jgi:hypothetical protein
VQLLFSYWVFCKYYEKAAAAFPPNEKGGCEIMTDEELPIVEEEGKAGEKRFGNIAVALGFITADQLNEAMKTQVTEEQSMGKHRLIGTILLEQKLISSWQLEEVLATIEKAQKNGTNCSEVDNHG